MQRNSRKSEIMIYREMILRGHGCVVELLAGGRFIIYSRGVRNGEGYQGSYEKERERARLRGHCV